MKINPPVFNSDEKTFELWKHEVDLWGDITTCEKKMQGIAVALSLPENDPTRIRFQIMEEVKREDLKKEDGL